MSGKVIWHAMMSLDGFIAGPNDDMQWVFSVDGGDRQTADEVLRSIGALLVGRRTQDVEDRVQGGFCGGAYSGPFFVLRHDPPSEPPIVKDVSGCFLDVLGGKVSRRHDFSRGVQRARACREDEACAGWCQGRIGVRRRVGERPSSG
jgi:RibD domain-containing protein